MNYQPSSPMKRLWNLISASAGVAFSNPASYRTYAPGDLILSHEDRLFLWEKEVEMVSSECGVNMTLLKEEYLILFDNITDVIINSSIHRSAHFSLYKNGEIVTRLNGKVGDFFYYNQTTDGGYILAGTIRSYGSGNKDGWLVKVGGEPEGTGNITMASQTGTGNIKRSIIVIPNRTERLAESPIQPVTSVPFDTNTIIPPKKTAGFEVVLAIIIYIAIYTIK
ncbi:MAG: hypothetical protein FIB07_17940 [Candidatus Methanoperedens sp.]|nr:hypothetical protein [Candidatus Methanoperedens sp.]